MGTESHYRDSLEHNPFCGWVCWDSQRTKWLVRSNDHFLLSAVYLVNVFLIFFFTNIVSFHLYRKVLFSFPIYIQEKWELKSFVRLHRERVGIPTQVFLTSEPVLLTSGVAFLKVKFSFYLSQNPQSETHCTTHMPYSKFLEVVKYTCAH